MGLNSIYRTFFFILFLSVLNLTARAGENRSNLGVIENELKSALDSVLQKILPGGDEIEIVFKNISDEKIAFLKTYLVDYLENKKNIVRIDTADYKIIIEQFTVAIVYEETNAKFWGVSDELNRQIIVTLRGVIESFKDHRFYALRIDRKYNDKISLHNKQTIENSPYSFSRGKLLRRSSWKSVIEPVVVSISAVTIILLFFVLRT